MEPTKRSAMALARGARVIAVSDQIAEMITERHRTPPEHIRVVPAAIDMGRAMRATDVMTLPWEMLGSAIAGGAVIAIVWCWVVYRLIRGTLRLADGRPVP